MEINTYLLKESDSIEKQIAGSVGENIMIISFVSPSYSKKEEFFKKVSELYPSAKIIGCSTSGEIFQDTLSDDSVAMSVCSFDNTRIKQVTIPVKSSEDSYSVGVELATSLRAEKLKGVFILSDGLSVNGTSLANGINDTLSGNPVITGGLAGDGDRFKETWIADRNGIKSNHVSAIGFYGDHINIGHGSVGGWDKFGIEKVITRSRGNVLYEIAGRPALDLYKEYLGDRASGLPATALLFPLSLRNSREDSDYLVRTVLAVDEENKSMTFAGDVPEGSLATFMKANFDRLVEGAGSAALSANIETNDPLLCLAISCVGRRLVLGESVEDEIDAVISNLPDQTKQIGFYSYGELSPHSNGKCELHNQTMTLTTISEKL
ncbi:MAG: FIST C-terminal domain-containing protein [Bdellovibrionales bacterium]|nr:FIST C-terminal domain-containing protein [Bdellovibrionales bacterium]